MSDNDIIKQTNVNVQEKANLIWAIADKLVGVYKPHEYGNVILPMCVIKRFEDTLAPTKEAVLKKNKELDEDGIPVKDGFLQAAAGQAFYNLSPFTFEILLRDPDNIADNFESYINHFSTNVIDIIHRMNFEAEMKKMADNGLLYLVIKEFTTPKAYLGADQVTSVDMGYIFEELVRKFSESYDEQAGAHFTARDIIYLMAELLVGDNEKKLRQEGITASIYDMAMGTSQMLGCLTERFLKIDPQADVTSFGQELNNQTFAIAKADTLIKGGNAENMRQGDTLGDDQFKHYKFDYIISNPPFGIEWKTSKAAVEREHNEEGEAGRFGPGLPAIGDGQMLFLLNGVAKLKDDGRMAIIQNGSSLFKGDAGSGESDIRGFLLENDWLEAIIQLPNDLFYNTGIATYIWVITKDKNENRRGKVQLIDASGCADKRRKPLGNKRVEITDRCRDLVMTAYHDFTNWEYDSEDGTLHVESKVFDNDYFKYTKLTTVRPLRLTYHDLQLPEADRVKKADREYLQMVIDTYKDSFNGHAVNDFAFFAMLRTRKVKFTAAQVKLIRTWLGTKDPEAKEVYKKPLETQGTDYEWDSDLSDTETIPWQQDIEEYLEQNVRPYAPDFQVDESKTKIGYEIPFTREFYKYVPLKPSNEIFSRLQKLGEREQELMTKILG